jgi:hypothetical protein
MRLSTVFETPRMPMPIAQGDEHASEKLAPVTAQPAPAKEVPDDLDQRVREIGEWQLEDW